MKTKTTLINIKLHATKTTKDLWSLIKIVMVLIGLLGLVGVVQVLNCDKGKTIKQCVFPKVDRKK